MVNALFIAAKCLTVRDFGSRKELCTDQVKHCIFNWDSLRLE